MTVNIKQKNFRTQTRFSKNLSKSALWSDPSKIAIHNCEQIMKKKLITNTWLYFNYLKVRKIIGNIDQNCLFSQNYCEINLYCINQHKLAQLRHNYDKICHLCATNENKFFSKLSGMVISPKYLIYSYSSAINRTEIRTKWISWGLILNYA